MEKDILLTPMQIYGKLLSLKNSYDISEWMMDFDKYVDNNSDILVDKNPAFDEAMEMMADDEREFKESLDSNEE